MNRIVIFMCILTTITYIHCSEPILAHRLSEALVNEDRRPTFALLELLKKTECSHNGTLPSIVASVAKLLRPIAQERWEGQSYISPDAESFQLFKKLCLVQEIVLTRKSYDYALLLGGVLDDVRTRLTYLIGLWNKGIRFNSLIILTGQRRLDQHIESKGLLLRNNVKNLPLPTTESEMIKFVFAQTNLPMEWKKPIIVDTPIQQMQDGSFRRPNTEDTITEWLRKHNPRPGSILAISNQPFIGYQHAVLRKNLPKNFFGETVGPAYENNESMATMHDTIARWLYNENQIPHIKPAKY